MIRKYSKYVLVLIFLLTLLMGYWATQLRFNYQVENLFPDSDEEVAFFREFRKQYENENDFLAIGIRAEESVFQEDFLRRVDSLTRSLRRVLHVKSVNSITERRFLKIGPMGLRRDFPLIHVEEPERYAKDSVFLFSIPVFTHNVISEDARALCIYLQIDKDIGYSEAGDTLLIAVQKIIDPFEFAEVNLSGGFYTHKTITRKLRAEIEIFAVLSIGLITIFLFLSFRFAAGIWIPLALVVLSSLYTIGLMAMMDVEINLMTALIPSIMFVVATSDAIHLMTRYIEELRKGFEKEAALQRAVREVGMATLLTSLTTAFGFLTLWTAGILPFRQFGTYTAIGVILAFVLTLLLMPALLIHMPVPSIARRQERQQFWPRTLHRMLRFVFRRKGFILGAFGLLIIGAIWGITRLTVHNYFADEIATHDEAGREIQFFEQEFGGVRPFAMSLSVRDTSQGVFDVACIRELEKIETYLATEYGLNRRYSLINNIKAAYCSLHNGQKQFYRLPRSDKSLARIIQQIRIYGEFYGLFNLMTPDEQHTRITGTLYDIGSTAVSERNRRFMDFVAAEIDTDLVSVRLTGAAQLIDRSNRLISRNMMQGLLIAILIVSLFMGILFRSFRMIFVSLIPNLVPLIAIAGYMGWAGIGLKMSTAIIFTIAFGIAVDDTIHFISRLRLELANGKSLLYAIKRTYLSTGKAIVITSLILASGFWVLLSSHFQGTYLTGLLVGATLVLAVIADLFLLPLLIWLAFGRSRSS